MPSIGSSFAAKHREAELTSRVGEVGVCSAIAFLATKIVTNSISAASGAIFIGVSVAITRLAGYIFKNSPNKNAIELLTLLCSMPIAVYCAQITLLNGFLIGSITAVSIMVLRLLNEQIN